MLDRFSDHCARRCVGAGLEKEDWPLPDPKGQGIEAVRETRDKIKERILDLLERKGWGRQ